MKIAHIDLNDHVAVIAEVGNNHEGNFDLACQMIEAAAESGADAVKFQTIIPEKMVEASQIDRIKQLKRYQFSFSQFEKLKNVCDKHGIVFLSTPFDLESARFLSNLVPAFKIASGDNTFFPLLDCVASFSKPIILSTGQARIGEIKSTVEHLERIYPAVPLCLLHCVTSYPTPESEANLARIFSLKNEFPRTTVGYSDHALGIRAAALSVACGARIVEKHFTIDKNYSQFRDHQLSADPEDMKQLVTWVRSASKMMGSGCDIQPCEEDMMQHVRRSISAAKDLPEGHVLTMSDLIWLRPATGLPPGQEFRILGRKLTTKIPSGMQILEKDLV